MLAAAITFDRWGGEHLAMLAATGAMTILVYRVCRTSARSSAALRFGPLLLVAIAVLIAGSEIGSHAWRVYEGIWNYRTNLPLHLCDLTGALVIWLLLERAVCFSHPPGRAARRFEELAYFWTLAGTTQALLTPDLASGFPSWPYWEFFVSHGAAWAAVVGLVLGGELRVRRGAFWGAWRVTLLVGACVGLLNIPLQSNYMYTCGPPEQASIYDYFGRWPWSLVTLAALGLLLFVLCEWLYRSVRKIPSL